MKKYFYLVVLITLYFNNALFSQAKRLYEFRGTAYDSSINFTDNPIVTLDRNITMDYEIKGKGMFFAKINCDEVLNNSLENVTRQIDNQDYITYTVSELPVADYYLNSIQFKVSAGYNKNTVGFNVHYNGMISSVDISNGFRTLPNSFPIKRWTLPSSASKYLASTALVEPTYSPIAERASYETSGCTDLRTAVFKLCKWIESNIRMDPGTDNTPNASASVFDNGYADCDGAAHLLAAFCRSQNIPARIVSGYFIEQGISFPIENSRYDTWSHGSGTTMVGHSACEIYIPNATGVGNWVRCDPAQRTVFFGWQNFIKMATGQDSKEHLDCGYNVTQIISEQNPKPQVKTMVMNRSISLGSNNTSFTLVRTEDFTGIPSTSANGYFFDAFGDYPTGINDHIAISGTETFRAGDAVSYNSTFTSPDGNLPTDRYWTINLHHTNGTYTYASQSGNLPFFYITTNTVLPDYDWVLNENGQILGDVTVNVGINDGSSTLAIMPVSIEKCNEATISNQTYTSNTTIASCYITLGNVSVQNNSNLFADSEMGITINGDINVDLGSTFNTNASRKYVIPTLGNSIVLQLDCNSANFEGIVTQDGGLSIVVRGVCWSTSPNPTTANSEVISGSDTGPFSATISPLVIGTTYYLRSFASNSVGTGYGAEVTYTPNINLPILDATAVASAITTNSATSGGNVTSDGCGTITERGICWATTFFPTTANSKLVIGSGTGSFTGNLTGLSANTTYYVRSYATNSAGTAYGAQISFTTLVPPVVVPTLAATNAVSAVTCTTAYSGGNVTSDGGGTITARGVCYGTTSNPTTADNKTIDSGTTGSWTSGTMTIVPGTTYYVRSYATNSAGTNYGTLVTYIQNVSLPQLSTTAASSITSSSASSGGNVASDGCGTVTARGICWATTQNPTTANSTCACGTGAGSFTGNLTGLSANTTYYVRSYATNSAGTAYGAQTSFTTLAVVVPTLATTAPSSITCNSASSGGNVTSDGCGTVTARGICWSTTQNPTTASSTCPNGSGIGTYTCNLTGLTAGTTSYATNSAGTAYGAQTSFTTLAVVVPTLATTNAVTAVTCTTASSGGNVTSDGCGTITARGVCYGTTSNPTIANSKTTDSGTTGSWTSGNMTMVPGTLYYVRSYATNSAGTGYGTEVTYTQNIAVPTLAATTTANSITCISASSGGNVTSDGCGTVTARGICWSTTQTPTTSNSTSTNGSGTGTYTGSLTGLTAGTTYYVRSYATNSAGTAYGAQTSFTTSAAVVPTLATTTTVSSITCNSASSGGNVTSDGCGTVTARGICWATTQNPTTANSTSSNGSGTGSYTGSLTGLTAGTTYYIRSYATNSAGTAYGSQTSFTTIAAVVPTLGTTTAVSSITCNSASSGGNVTSDGCGTVTARGICWSTSQTPTTSNSTSTNGSGTGTYTCNLTGLTAGTTYYVRSYATNSAGTTYGTQTSFQTLPASITATITSSLLTSGSTYYVVQWNVTLSSPAMGNIVIPCITTNGTNTGNTTSSLSFSTGQTYNGANTVTYTRPTGSNFTASCTFGTMPAGYVAGGTSSYVIVKK